MLYVYTNPSVKYLFRVSNKVHTQKWTRYIVVTYNLQLNILVKIYIKLYAITIISATVHFNL